MVNKVSVDQAAWSQTIIGGCSVFLWESGGLSPNAAAAVAAPSQLLLVAIIPKQTKSASEGVLPRHACPGRCIVGGGEPVAVVVQTPIGDRIPRGHNLSAVGVMLPVDLVDNAVV